MKAWNCICAKRNMQRKPAESLTVCHTFKLGSRLSPDTFWICFRAGESLKEREAERPRHGNTSSATAANGKTSKECSGKRWGKQQGGERADADTCRSELFSMEKCDMAVMDFLADVGKFPRRRMEE